MSDSKTASFGFRDVPEAEKEGLVREVFSSVAARYDLMNDVMSGGIHRIWKDAMVEWLNPRPGWRVLDVAGGTGDIAFRIAEMARARGGEAALTVCDINADMLGEGRRRAQAKGENTIDWVCGDAESLPFADAQFDAYTIAFGIRNVTHIDAALREARRVLKPGGRFLCLEFSKVNMPGLDALYDAYSFKLLPKNGRVGGRRRAILSLSRRKHSPLSAAGPVRAHDRASGPRPSQDPHRSPAASRRCIRPGASDG